MEEQNKKQEGEGVTKPTCDHFGHYAFAGGSQMKDTNGDILFPINLFCKRCGQTFIRITKVEVPKEEEMPAQEAKKEAN